MALQTIKVRQLGTKGVVSDVAPYDNELQSWSDAKNIRFSNGRAMKMQGHIPIFYENRGNEEIPMHLIHSPQSDTDWYYCTQDDIYYTNGWVHVSMLEKKLEQKIPYDAPWSSAILSNSVMVTSRQLKAPLGLASGEGEFKPLPKWGPWDSDIIRSYKNFAMALGGGDSYPQRVRWSNVVPPNALPADWGWEITAQGQEGAFIKGSAGGYNDLSFAKGKIVDGKPLRDQFIIYTDEEVISCDYVGGNDIFRFKNLFDEGGAINPDCVAAFDNKHFVVSANDVYVHNGSSKESVIDGKVRDRLLDQLTAKSYTSVKVIPYLPENEIWVIFAGTDATGFEDSSFVEATLAAVYNYKYETWSFIEIPPAMDIKLGPIEIYDSGGDPVRTWDNLPENYLWEDAIELWNLAGEGSSSNFKQQSLVCASKDGGFYVLDRGTYFSKLGPRDSEGKYTIVRDNIIGVLTKTYIDMDEITDTIDYKTILSIWPQILNSGTLFIQVGGSPTSGGSIAWNQPVQFICGEDRKVDLRENSRYLSLSIQGRGDGDWQLSGFDATLRIGGRR